MKKLLNPLVEFISEMMLAGVFILILLSTFILGLNLTPEQSIAPDKNNVLGTNINQQFRFSRPATEQLSNLKSLSFDQQTSKVTSNFEFYQLVETTPIQILGVYNVSDQEQILWLQIDSSAELSKLNNKLINTTNNQEIAPSGQSNLYKLVLAPDQHAKLTLEYQINKAIEVPVTIQAEAFWQ